MGVLQVGPDNVLQPLKQYRLSTKNTSLNPRHPGSLVGRVDKDLTLTILLEPGAATPPTEPSAEAQAVEKALQSTRLEGLPAEIAVGD